MELGFVILNYNTYQETIECIQSIENKVDTKNYVVVIVDNASKDDSADKIERFILDKSYMHLLRNEQNLGFARGNNIGIKYLNDTYCPQFVVVLNSDTELIQENLFHKLLAEYKKSEFSLLGPLILTKNGHCDNSPHFSPKLDTALKDLKRLKKERILIKCGMYRIYCVKNYFCHLFKTKVLKKAYPMHRYKDFFRYQKQVVLQGCFLVFSKKAFECVKGFDERTFLYYEEPILFLHLRKCGLTTVYTPEIVIFHKDGCATNTMEKKSKARLLFINSCYQDSVKVLINVIKELENDNIKSKF